MRSVHGRMRVLGRSEWFEVVAQLYRDSVLQGTVTINHTALADALEVGSLCLLGTGGAEPVTVEVAHFVRQPGYRQIARADVKQVEPAHPV
jgi:hypothetical protein